MMYKFHAFRDSKACDLFVSRLCLIVVKTAVCQFHRLGGG